MKDNFVDFLKMAGLRRYMMVCLMFVGASMFSMINARSLGNSKTYTASPKVRLSISPHVSQNPPTDYQLGSLLSKAINLEIVSKLPQIVVHCNLKSIKNAKTTAIITNQQNSLILPQALEGNVEDNARINKNMNI
jgi:hypothetical protein